MTITLRSLLVAVVLTSFSNLASATLPAFVDGQALPTLAPLVERVSPAVVNIAVMGQAGPAHPMCSDPFFSQFPQCQNREFRGGGSGVIVDAKNGYILTNHHVVDRADRIRITLLDKRTLDATVIGSDPLSDIAVLKVDPDNLHEIPIADSSAARVGDFVVAIGNPFGLQHTVTSGIISALGRSGLNNENYEDFIQTDAAINMGNSGGALIDLKGQLLGINSAIISNSGGSVGIGFAIPASQAKTAVQQIIEDGYVTRGWLGVQIQPVTEDIQASLGLEGTQGALVSDVNKDSPAAKSGLEVTDVILAFDGKQIADTRELVRLVAKTRPDQKVPVSIWREGRKRDIEVKIGTLKDPEQEIVASNQPSSETGKLGLKIAPLDNQSRERLRLDESIEGALVTGVAPDSPAARQGLRPGDVIMRIGQSRVDSPKALSDAVESAGKNGDDSVLALVRRGDSQRFVALKLG